MARLKFKTKNFKIGGRKTLDSVPTNIPDLYRSNSESLEILKDLQSQISDYQERLFADQRQSLLIILQGMDAAGKDGLIKHVMTGINPQGVSISSFKSPSANELSHDFLWRTHHEIPPAGKIGIFNRSYYEEVIVTRVHPELLRLQQRTEVSPTRHKFWALRMEDITHHEEYLERQGTRILKIFLNLSKATQKRRLLERIENPAKHWKFEPSDVAERAYWTQYHRAYSECLKATSTQLNPWYALPADNKTNTRLMTSRLILETMESMEIRPLRASPEKLRGIKKAKKILLKERGS